MSERGMWVSSGLFLDAQGLWQHICSASSKSNSYDPSVPSRAQNEKAG